MDKITKIENGIRHGVTEKGEYFTEVVGMGKTRIVYTAESMKRYMEEASRLRGIGRNSLTMEAKAKKVARYLGVEV